MYLEFCSNDCTTQKLVLQAHLFRTCSVLVSLIHYYFESYTHCKKSGPEDSCSLIYFPFIFMSGTNDFFIKTFISVLFKIVNEIVTTIRFFVILDMRKNVTSVF